MQDLDSLPKTQLRAVSGPEGIPVPGLQRHGRPDVREVQRPEVLHLPGLPGKTPGNLPPVPGLGMGGRGPGRAEAEVRSVWRQGIAALQYLRRAWPGAVPDVLRPRDGEHVFEAKAPSRTPQMLPMPGHRNRPMRVLRVIRIAPGEHPAREFTDGASAAGPNS
jgi:hypothetical protein